jgi:hypothetical protein
MHLIALNLQKSTAINAATYGASQYAFIISAVFGKLMISNFICVQSVGNFSGPKNHEIVVARENLIELLRPDDAGNMVSICATPVFSIVRTIVPFRLAGESLT